MLPILGIAAGRVGMNIAENITENYKSRRSDELQPAEKTAAASFDGALANVLQSPRVQNLNFLAQQGIQSWDDSRAVVKELSRQIADAPEIREITHGGTRDYKMRIRQDGIVELHLANGRTRTVTLTGAAKDAALEAREILTVARSTWPQKVNPFNRLESKPSDFREIAAARVSGEGVAFQRGPIDPAMSDTIRINPGGEATMLP